MVKIAEVMKLELPQVPIPEARPAPMTNQDAINASMHGPFCGEWVAPPPQNSFAVEPMLSKVVKRARGRAVPRPLGALAPELELQHGGQHLQIRCCPDELASESCDPVPRDVACLPTSECSLSNAHIERIVSTNICRSKPCVSVTLYPTAVLQTACAFTGTDHYTCHKLLAQQLHHSVLHWMSHTVPGRSVARSCLSRSICTTRVVSVRPPGIFSSRFVSQRSMQARYRH